MKILITGGAGFIGSHLCRRLIQDGHKVICVDNLFTGSEKNIKPLVKNRMFKFIKHDIIEPFFVEDIGQIYNLACPASPIHYQENPIRTIKASTVGMINMLGIAKKTKARILQASTSEVYGDPREHPQRETYLGNVNSIGIRACYDEGKRMAETLCFDYYREHNVDIRVARIFNTYGPRMHLNDGRVVSNFIVQALRGEPLTIYGKGLQTRSFCYVDDLVEGLIKLMNNEKTTGPVNLGNPHEIMVKELAQKITKLSKSASKIKFLPLPADDPHCRQPDITLAKIVLKWNPKISLEEGLLKTIEYFRKVI